jgi:hypothetical protein
VAVLAGFRLAFRPVHVENKDAGERTGDYSYALNATFLKGGTQTYASDTSAVWEDDPKPRGPKPREWLCGLAAGWRLS